MTLQPGCHPTEPEPGPPSPPPIHLDSGLSEEELRTLYHGPEGSEFMPLGILRALRTSDGKPFLASPERFGLLKDPENPELPIGMSKHRFKDKGVAFEWVGFNCAACHVNEFTYQGKTVRVDGAPGRLNLSVFYRELTASLGNTLKDPFELAGFLFRFAEQRSPRRENESKASLLRRVYATDPLPQDDAQIEAYVVSQVNRYAQQALKGRTQLAKTSRLRPMSEEDVNTLAKTVDFLVGHYNYLVKLGNVKSPTAAGPGRLDAFGGTRALLFDKDHELTAPVSYPFLWGTGEQTWFHYDGNTNTRLQRNMGQALSLGATFDTLLPRELHKLGNVTSRIKPPTWPKEVLGEIDKEQSDVGGKLYFDHCASCHGPKGPGGSPSSPQDVGTDRERLETFNKPVDGVPFAKKFGELLRNLEDKAFEDAGISSAERKAMEVDSPEWTGTDGYMARPLSGIWATAPYLHNGSVPTLRDLLEPAEKRPTCFRVGQREYDPKALGYDIREDSTGKCSTTPETCRTPRSEGFTQWFDVRCQGNSNAGHEYGTDLTDEEKLQLLEYLKTL